MGDPNYIALNNNVNFNTVVETIIKKRCIIDYGIVESVPANGVVEVAVAVSDTPENMCYLTCVLANIASSSFTVNIKPNVGDRVLVVYPRLYDERMFNVPDSDEDKTKIIQNEKANGYNIMSGIAILLNQYKTACHKNVLSIDENITLEHNNTKLVISENDEITVDTGKAEIKIDNSGNVTIDAKNGKISLKNSSTNLYSILNGILNVLNTSLKTTGTSSAQTVVPQQFSVQATQLGQLMQ
jgi:hypothetical protein